MPRANSLATLPADILTELDKRLVKTGYSAFVAHAAWLKSIGYPISKSTIGRYCKDNRDSIAAQSKSASMSDYEIASLKLKCLAICANAHKDDRFAKATELFEWATNAKYKHVNL